MKRNNDQIMSWRPFVAKVFGRTIRFTCPKCGGHNCKKAPHSSGRHFLEGHYVCPDCGETECYNKSSGHMEAICYYSDCFSEQKQIQLTLY